MYETIDAPDNVVAFKFTGVLTGDDVQHYQKLMDQKLSEHKHIGFCIDITGFSDVALNAMTKGVIADIDFLKHLKQIDRLAFVSDKQWPRIGVNVLKHLLPGVEAQVFNTGERAQAIAWAAQTTKPKAESVGPAINILKTNKDNVFAFEMNHTIRGEDLKPLIAQFDAVMKKHERVRVLNHIKHLGINPSVFFQSGLVGMKIAGIRKVERYAIVGSPGWIARVARMINPLFPGMDIKTFSEDELDRAWDWLGAKQA